MKKILALMVLGLTLLATVALTGCVDTESQEIDGVIYNRSDYVCVLRFYNTATGQMLKTVQCEINDTRGVSLWPGTFTIKGYSVIGGELIYIDEYQVLIRATTSSFSIYVDNDSVSVTTT